MPVTPRPRPRDDARFFLVVVGWSVIAILARLLYFVVFEPQLGESTYVYFSGRGSAGGFMLATPDWTALLWAVAALNLIALAVTVLSTILTNNYHALPTVLGLLLAGASVASILGHGILTVLYVSGSDGDLLASLVIFLGAGAAACSTLLLPPPAREIMFSKKTS